MKDEDIKALVDRFLAWPLPQTVCSDLCVTNANYKSPRSGTNLLTAEEARQMIKYLLTPPNVTRVRMNLEQIEDKNMLHIAKTKEFGKL